MTTAARAARQWAGLQGSTAARVRLAHVAVTLLAAALYLWNLTLSGFGNTYYAAAALAASQNWTDWFFGSFDSSNFITVDKPPLSTMLMGLSVKLFGLSSWSVLLPQALAGIATVALLFAIVRRSFGLMAATIAGIVMAVTPVAALVFRYDNPDALLTLLLVAAAGALLRGLENGRVRWAVLAAVLVGFAFNTKFLQAYLVLPAFAVVWAVAAPGDVRGRLAGLGAAAAAPVVGSSWWVLAVALTPAGDRPYIGGSTTNSAFDLLLGYDGLARVFRISLGGGAAATGSAVATGSAIATAGSGGDVGPSGAPGLLRLLDPQLGGQIAWLLPFAAVALIGGLLIRGRAPRTDGRRAAYLVWGLWLAVHALVFSFMTGTIHTYYTIAMAPAIAALVGGGAVEMWALRSRMRFGGIPLGVAILSSAVMAWVLLERTPDFVPGLAIAVLAVGIIAAALIAMPVEIGRAVRLAAAALALAALLVGPVSYSIYTVGAAYNGGDPSAGPPVAAADGTGGRGAGPAGGPGPNQPGLPAGRASQGGFTYRGQDRYPDPLLVAYLVANRGSARWIVAVTSADDDGPLELETGLPIMAMGGFKGSDPAPSLAQLQAYIASGQLRYVVVGGGQGGGPGSAGAPAGSQAGLNDAWVTSACRIVDFGSGAADSPLYDCSAAVASAG